MKDRTNAILSARVGSVTSLRVDYAAEVNASGKSKDYSFYRIPDLKGKLSKRDFMIFIKVKPMPAGSLDLADFLFYMLGKNYLTEVEYVKNIDFGNEVWYGQGETIVSRFDVALTGR
jgi:hypothetical protein